MSGKWLVIVSVAMLVVSGAAFAVTEQDVTLTVTIRSLGVSVTPTSYSFGMMNTSETKVSDPALVVKNEGNVAEDVGLRIKDEDDWNEWTASSTPNPNVYVLSTRLAATAGTFGASDILTTGVVWCEGTKFGSGGNDMASLASVNQWFQLQSPTLVSGTHAYDEHTMTVEVSCREAE